MMKFFLRMRQSVYDPSFYEEEVLNEGLGRALRQVFGVALLIAFFSAVVFIVLRGQAVSQFSKRILPDILDTYPAELEMTLKDGAVTVNQDTPIVIPWPNALRELSGGRLPSETLVVIDPSTPFSLEQFRKLHAMAWIFDNGAVIQSGTVDAESGGMSDRGLRLYDLPKDKTVTITRESLASKLDALRTLAKLAPFIVTAAVFAGIWSVNLFYALYLIPMALCILLAVRVVRRRTISFGQAYRAGAYAMTPGMIMWGIVAAFGAPLHIPFGFTALLLLITVANVQEKKLRPVIMP